MSHRSLQQRRDILFNRISLLSVRHTFLNINCYLFPVDSQNDLTIFENSKTSELQLICRDTIPEIASDLFGLILLTVVVKYGIGNFNLVRSVFIYKNDIRISDIVNTLIPDLCRATE